MNKNIEKKKCENLQYKINKNHCKFYDMNLIKLKKSYDDLEKHIQKIYSRYRKIYKRNINHLIDKVTINTF